jgi:hypothetical protein
MLNSLPISFNLTASSGVVLTPEDRSILEARLTRLYAAIASRDAKTFVGSGRIDSNAIHVLERAARDYLVSVAMVAIKEPRPCPFKVGDLVVFTDRSGKVDFPGQMGTPAKGDIVRVTAIRQGVYLEWEGMGDSPAGGIHWAEFEPAPNTA